MKRNQFILLSAAGIAALGTSAWYLKYYDSELPKSLEEPQDLSLIWNSQMIIAMGEIYRKQRPDEDNPQTLHKLLLQKETDTRIAVEALKKTIQTDFETGNTLLLDGWILSRTEARQCALFSLTSKA